MREVSSSILATVHGFNFYEQRCTRSETDVFSYGSTLPNDGERLNVFVKLPAWVMQLVAVSYTEHQQPALTAQLFDDLSRVSGLITEFRLGEATLLNLTGVDEALEVALDPQMGVAGYGPRWILARAPRRAVLL